MGWRYRDTVLVCCTLAFFVTMVGRLAVSPVVPEITAEFEVSNTLVGVALSGMWLAYALAQYPSGVLADRHGERLVILASVAGTGLTSLLIVFSPHFAVFFVGTVLVGGAAGLHYSVATSLLSRTYDDLGTAIGIHNGGAPVAGLVTPVVVAWLAVRYGWRPAVALTVAIAVPATLLFAWRVRPTEPAHPDRGLRDSLAIGPMLEILTRPPILYTGAIAIICDFIWQAVASFLPTFLVQFRGFSTTTAGILFAGYFVVQGVLQIGIGRLSDRIGRDAATAVCTIAGIVGFGLLIAPTSLPWVLVGITLVGTSMGWGAAVLPRFMDHLSAEERGVGFGLIRTVYMVVAASGSIVVGLFADLFGWGVSFGVLIALLGVVGCLLTANWLLELEY